MVVWLGTLRVCFHSWVEWEIVALHSRVWYHEPGFSNGCLHGSRHEGAVVLLPGFA